MSTCVSTGTDKGGPEPEPLDMATQSIRCTIGWHHWTFANGDHTGVRSCANCCEQRYHVSHRAVHVAWFDLVDVDGGGDGGGDGGDGGGD